MLVTFGGIAATPLDDITGGSPTPQPLGSIPILRAVVYLLTVAGQVSFVTFLTFFPSERFVQRWTCFIIPGWILLFLLGSALLSPEIFAELLFGFLVISLAAHVYRYRRGESAVGVPGARHVELPGG